MNKTYIIAEIAQGFEGNPWICKKFIELAKKCGASAVKFQIFYADEICTENYTYYHLFKSLEIAEQIWVDLIDYAHSIGIDFISDIFGTKTLEWIAGTKIKGLKIHSTDVKNFELLKQLSKTGKDIYLSTGGSKIEEIEEALKYLNRDKVTLLTGFQAEPNELFDVELDKIQFLKNKFLLPVGYADHIDPKSPMAIVLPSMSVLAGATVVEKHLTIERDHLQIEDYISALNPAEFIEMVELIRNTECFTNTGNGYFLGEREHNYRLRMKKNVLAARDLPAKHVIREADVVLLRTGYQINDNAYFDKTDVVGKIITSAIKKHEIILPSLLENK